MTASTVYGLWLGPGGTLSQTEADLRYVRLSGDTLTGPLAFSGADHAGIRLNNLTTTEREALTPAAGHLIYNTTDNRFEFRNNASWEQPVRRSGDTLTGPLLLAAGGSQTAPILAFAGETNTGFYSNTGGLIFVTSGARRAVLSGGLLQLGASGILGWSSITQPSGTGSDLELTRDAADILAQRRGTNPQTARLYGTYTDSSNYERLSLTANATAITLASEAAGTGTRRNLAVDAPQVSLAGPLVVSGGTVTADAPLLNLSQTWNASGVTFTGLKANVTDTASALASMLIDLQVGGVSKFNIRASDGKITGGAALLLNSLSLGQTGTGQVTVRAAGSFGWANDNVGTAPQDLSLYRDAADILAQRRSTNPQTLRVYGSYTDASNYERAGLRWNANVFEIGPEAAGTGTQRQLAFPLGTVAADTPLNITQTWNNAGVTFTGLKANVTDTASAAASLLMDLQVGGVSKEKTDKDGNKTLTGLCQATGFTFGSDRTYSYVASQGYLIARLGSGIFVGAEGGFADRLFLKSTGSLEFSNSASLPGAPDLKLFRDAADTLAQRRSTNPQTLRVYGTYTDSSNYERLSLTANSTAITLASEAAGTGTRRNIAVDAPQVALTGPLVFQGNQAGAMLIADNGSVIANSNPAVNFRIQRNDGVGQFLHNLVWSGSQWQIETASKTANLLECGQEGIGFFTLPSGAAGTGGLVEIMRVRDEGGVVILTGQALGVGISKAAALQNPLTISGTAPTHGLIYATRESSLTNGIASGLRIRHNTSATIAEGFGCAVQFSIDSGAIAETLIADITATRSGADNSGAFAIRTASVGSLTEKMRVSPAGDVGIGVTDPKFKTHIAGRLAYGVPATAPTDADLSAGQVSAYLDETTHKLLFRVKYADGTTLKSGGTVLDGGRLQLPAHDEATASPTISGGTLTLDLAQGNVFNVAQDADITTLAFSNVPASGRLVSVTLILTQDATGGWTIAWPAAVKWDGGVAPTLVTTAASTALLSLLSFDGGTTWLGFLAGSDLK